MSKFRIFLNRNNRFSLLLFLILVVCFIVASIISLTHLKIEEASSVENQQAFSPSSYIYGETTPIFIGGNENSTSAFIDLKLRFRVTKDSSGYPNLFQTGPVNSGIRMEFLNSTAALIIPDKNVEGGLKGIPISSSIMLGEWYSLDLYALNGSHVDIYLNSKRIGSYQSSGINFSLAQIILGQGFSSDRKFQGDIKNIFITYGQKVKNKNIAIFSFSTVIAVAIFFWLSLLTAEKFKLNSKLIGLWCSIVPVALYDSFIFSRLRVQR